MRTVSFYIVFFIVIGTSFRAFAKEGNKSAGKTTADFFLNIRDYGAKGDGISVDTKAINDAITAAANKGGGTVYFPAGTFLSYSIHLKSNIALYFDPGCILLAADSSAGGNYDAAEPNAFDRYQDFGHSHWHNSLIWGEDLENISITGPGLIWGKGLTRRTPRKTGEGNKAIALKNCRQVILRDFTILMGGHFAILATGVDNFTIDNLTMDTNRDGMDIDCCKNVHISNCTVNSPWDDGICLKSSFGLGYARATENVTITNCQVSGYDTGSLWRGTYLREQRYRVPDRGEPTGRIKFGTESNGGFKNITISNCVFDFCRGLALETVDGGLLEDVTITNITMRDIVNAPVFLRLGARMRGPDGVPAGQLRRVTISNMVVYNADSRYASSITGVPGHAIEDIKLNNIRIYYAPLDSASVKKIQSAVPEDEKGYPEPSRLGILPAYGFYLRHVKNIELNNIEVNCQAVENRPAIWFDDVKGADIFRVKAPAAPGVRPFVFKDVENIRLRETNNIRDRKIKKTENRTL